MSARLMITRFRLFLLIMAGLAVGVQSLIPAGFMPGEGGRAGSFITICSGMGEKTVYVPDEHAPDHQAAQNACAYSFLIAAAQPLPPVVPVFVATSLVEAFAPDASRLASFSLLDPAHPPTGPPAYL